MTPLRSPSARPAPLRGTRTLTVRHRLMPALVTGLVLLSALPAVAAAPPTTSSAPSSASTAQTGSPSSTGRSIVLRPAVERMPKTWKRSFVIPYGDGRKQLGTGLEGDGEGLRVGPNHGAQGPDGSWWFIDTHKFRLARYSSKGRFLQELKVPKEHLVGGRYFPHQLPRVLNDGTFLAGNIVAGGTDMLRANHGRIDTVRLDREVGIRTDDGRKLYGFDWEGPMVEADIRTGRVRDTNWFRTRSGERYRVTLIDGKLRVVLPDARRPVDRTWAVTTRNGEPVQAQVQVASGTDGTLHLLLTGFEDRPGAPDLAGYTTISRHGKLAPVERTLNPFGPTDPGSPSHLGVRPKSTTPWLMFLREDGVHVYQRR
jgi:hypothetical protein